MRRAPVRRAAVTISLADMAIVVLPAPGSRRAWEVSQFWQ